MQEKDKARVDGMQLSIEEKKIVQTLQKEKEALEKQNEQLKNELTLNKHLLEEEKKKFFTKNQNEKELKKDKRLLEQFVKIETKSPQ